MGSKSSKLVAAALAATSLTVVASPVARAGVNLQAEQRATQAAEAAQHPGNTIQAEQRAAQAAEAAQHPRQAVRAVRVDLRSPDARDAAASRTIDTIRPPTVQSPTGGGSTPSGFDWGDAGIGAGGTVGLLLLGIGGTLVVSHRRPRELKRSGRSTLAS